MNVIGLDFGTTNSTISFYNDKTKTIEAWKMGGSDGKNYIPTILTINDKSIYIGEEAKTFFKNGDKETYSKFKILLHDTDAQKLSSYNYRKITPKEIAKKYIQTLLDIYKKEQNIQSIESIVITVPEIWLNDDMKGRAVIDSIAKELDLPYKFISEPVAAGAYFLHNYKEKKQLSFNGHLLVFDYGGGTLDITLIEAQNEHLKVLERTGKGRDKLEIGKAGALYDEKVVMHLYEKIFREKLQKNSSDFNELIIEFEKLKIDNKGIIASNIAKYQKNSKIDMEVFNFYCSKGKISVKASDLVKVFDEVLKNDIEASLNEIKEYFKVYGINTETSEEFRVIMVGGFSNFYLSYSEVKTFFNSITDSDTRFQTDFSLEDTTLAVSKGAALIASKNVKIDETYPMTIGIDLYKATLSGELEKFKEPIFKKGEIVKAHTVSFSEAKIKNTNKIPIFIDNGKHSFPIQLDRHPENIFPNYSLENNTWQIGFSIDKNSFFYLHIKDISGKEIKTEIGNIIEQSKYILIAEDKK